MLLTFSTKIYKRPLMLLFTVTDADKKGGMIWQQWNIVVKISYKTNV